MDPSRGRKFLLIFGKERQLIRGKRIGLVATGGNVDHDVFARVLQD
jgi:hypothetical protein